MRNIQEIFNVVIEAGLYPNPLKFDPMRLEGMCFAIDRAKEFEKITAEEWYAADKAIKEYLCGYGWLQDALISNAHNASIADCLKIYSNWESRPEIRWMY